jgi:hypothetical protein
VDICNGLERAIQQATAWAKRHASVFAFDKFQLTNSPRRYRLADTGHVIQVERTEIHPSTSSKYLRIAFDTALKWKQHVQNLKIKIKMSTGALASLAGSTWGAKCHGAQNDLPSSRHPSDDVWLLGMIYCPRTRKSIFKTDC